MPHNLHIFLSRIYVGYGLFDIHYCLGDNSCPVISLRLSRIYGSLGIHSCQFGDSRIQHFGGTRWWSWSVVGLQDKLEGLLKSSRKMGKKLFTQCCSVLSYLNLRKCFES